MEDEEDEVVVVDDKLFVEENGAPTRFFLHPSIKQLGARLALESKIEQYGGAISPTDVGSNVILVNPKHQSGDPDKIRRAYKTHSDPELHGVYVEPMAWVNNMVKTGKVVHHFIQKGMGGAVRGGDRERTAFTEDDDYRLARYLAVLIPDKSDGGRLGTNIYRALMENHETLPDEYYWVLHHTWQSWRERYKKNQGWFDERIAELAAQIKPAAHQKYELSRKATRSSAHRNKGYDMYSPEPEEEEEEEEEVDQLESEEEDAASRKRHISTSGSQRAAKRMRIESTPPPHPDGAQDASTASKGKEKALPEDDDDGYRSEDSLFDGPDLDPTQQTSPFKATQATLVGTAPPMPPSDPPQASPEPEVVPEPPRRQRPARSKRISAARPIDARPAPPMRQTARKVAEPPTPYRSTRARLGSLEPYVDDLDAVTRKNRQKGKKKALERLEEEERRVEEERDRDTREPEGTAETQEVEDLLMAANEQSGVSDGGNTIEDVDVDRMPPPRSTVRPAARQRQRHSPLETDDNQTDLALRRQQVSFSPAPSAREVLRDLVGPRLSSRAPESITSRAPSLAISPRLAHAQNSPPDDVFGGSRRGGSVQVQVPSVDPSNPLYSQNAPAFSRKGSASSTELFPLAGTRAKEVKHEIREQEKRTPYRPPARTRALEHVVNTR